MNPKELAAEAAKRADDDLGLNLAPAAAAQLIAIIQTCIEKAHNDGYRQGAIDGVLNERESRAAHASEPRCVFCHALLPKDAGEGQPVIGTVICKGCAALPQAVKTIEVSSDSRIPILTR